MTGSLTFNYTNWRGEKSRRRVRPISIRYGTSEYHPVPQWLMLADDLEKNQQREFVIAEMTDVLDEDDIPPIEQLLTAIAQEERDKSDKPFQARVDPWLMACFGETIARDVHERSHRFLEEALELVQANGCSADEAHAIVDYVYGRDQGDINQETGGVMVTLAALCLATGVDMDAAAEKELARVWGKVEVIRAKHFAKPKFSPLPGA